MNCLNCHVGTMKPELVETWFKRDGRWELVTNIPAMVCDSCEERVFSQTAVDRVEHVLRNYDLAGLRR